MPTTSTDPRAAAAALLVPGTTCHGFAVERRETVPELDSDAYVLRHTASGARLLYLACDDENKAFAIGFKTPPADSTGVFHILEHSVLCGSAKFPVKEPFVPLHRATALCGCLYASLHSDYVRLTASVLAWYGRQPMLFPLPFGGRGQGLGDKTVNSNIFEF